MDFYASLTINRCHLERLCGIWADLQPEDSFPFRNVIVSPLFVRNGILPRLYKQRNQCRIIFDSGGFHVQQGRMKLLVACRRLIRFYQQNGWAHCFVLPDAPITSFDSPKMVRQKLRATRRQYKTFPVKLPHSFRRKLLPVVHGTTLHEILANADAARRVGSRSLGFGGFSTSGPNSGVNSFTEHSLQLLLGLTERCAEWGLDTHAFGVGGPGAIAVLRYVPVQTFDSAGWIRTAAYGNVYLPYLGAVNVTGGTKSRRYVTRREFAKLRRATGHYCPFCANEALLLRSWRHRALHNYCTIVSAADELEKTPAGKALERLRRFNPRFAGYLSIVLQRRRRNVAIPESAASD